MKTINFKLYIFALSTIASLLFYDQDIGLNVFLFSVISIGLFTYINRPKINREYLVGVIPVLLSSLFIVFYPQYFSFVIWLIAYLLFVSSAKASKYILVLFYQGVLSILSSPISIFKTNKKQKQTNIEGVSLNNWIVYFFIGLILFVFTFLYLKSNPVLGQLFKNIDFSFINIGFVFFTLFQFLMLFGLYKIDTSKNIEQLNLKSILLSRGTFKNEDFEEFKVAKISILALGVLLTFSNITDLVVILSGKLPEGLSYSAYLHQSFNILLFTLVLSIALIIYFFRGNLNFHIQNKFLKQITVFWIIQNIILGCITCYKNFIYVQVYGLTYKRLVVFIAVFIVLLGLGTTIYKIAKPYTNWFYFNLVTKGLCLLLCIFSFIKYDHLITNYNLNYSETVDLEYILKLKQPKLQAVEKFLDNKTTYSKFKAELDKLKLRRQAKLQNQSWQSWSYNQ